MLTAALGPLRRRLDRQGDVLLDEAVAELLAEGELTRHLKRARRHYQQRRDAACQILREELAPWFTFTVPAGGWPSGATSTLPWTYPDSPPTATQWD